jgi:copper chaperone CopZ
MLWLLLTLVAVGAFIWYVNRDEKIDSNDDGKVDVSEAKAAVEKAAADVNKDGKVDVADVKEAGKKAKAGAKKAAAKVKKPKLKVAK